MVFAFPVCDRRLGPNSAGKHCGMKPAAFALLAAGILVSACASYPVYVSQAPPVPLVSDLDHQQECALIRGEIARELRTAALSGVMETALVEASVRLNVANVVYGLQTRAAIEGCQV